MNRFYVALLGILAVVSCVGVSRNPDVCGKVRIPYPMVAEGYPAHVHLTWNDNIGSEYDIYRSESGKFIKCAEVTGNEFMASARLQTLLQMLSLVM